MNQPKITPCLWFNNNVEEAVALYTSVFKNSKIKTVSRYGEKSAEASGMPKGSILTQVFELAGQEFMALNGGPHFQFTPAVSFFVWCEDEKEINDLWAKLSEDGDVLMTLGKYPFSEQYGFCQDRFGVAWQLMIHKRPQKISPALLFLNEMAGRGEEAMKFYTSLFKDSKIEMADRDPKTNLILHGRFTLAGQNFVAMESPVHHEFTLTPAVSFVVNCDDQKEIDDFWQKLSADPTAEQCGWVKDKFGFSWQIVPRIVGELISGLDSKKTERVMGAVMKMKKLDIKELLSAAQE
jgi:predicted 3-demethylubiquinone-9 3-methyltransferase (glyoxalase superfamily)